MYVSQPLALFLCFTQCNQLGIQKHQIIVAVAFTYY